MALASPVLKWSGAKWKIAPWILKHLPPHDSYLELYFGSGAVLFCKERSATETVNDLAGDVVNLFRVLREQPEDLGRLLALTPWSREEYETCRLAGRDEGTELERARRFLVVCHQQIGVRYGRTNWTGGWRTSRESNQAPALTWLRMPERVRAAAERLLGVQIECRPALDVIRRYDHPEVAIYADPPYPLATRSRPLYEHEMTDADHRELLDALGAHPGPVLLSGYRCPLYDDRLAFWTRHDRETRAQSNALRTESLWLNNVAVERLGNQGLFSSVPESPGTFEEA